MNSITRVIKAINHQPVTPVPRGELVLEPAFAREFLERGNISTRPQTALEADCRIACCRKLRLDLICLSGGGTAPDNPDLPQRLDTVRQASADGLFVFWVVAGSFQRAMESRGMTAFFKQVAAEPAGAGKALQQATGEVIADMAIGVAAGAHGIILADDIAYRRSTYTSPDFIRQHLTPAWQAQAAGAGELGVPVFFHSDGNIGAVLPDIAAAGFDGLHGLEPAAGMRIGDIKATYGRRLCLMGNLDPALLSGHGGRAEVAARRRRLRRAVSDLLTTAEGEGGFIFGTCSGLHTGLSPALVDYMYQLALDPALFQPERQPE